LDLLGRINGGLEPIAQRIQSWLDEGTSADKGSWVIGELLGIYRFALKFSGLGKTQP
jgi:hypothetical protein